MAEEKRLDVKERKPFLTSNQIGIAAAFGGAAFAFRALGISVPLVPPLVMDPGALMPCLAGMAGGPVVGAIVLPEEFHQAHQLWIFGLSP